jgi:tetratricopeptide (TPR) repeat protein
MSISRESVVRVPNARWLAIACALVCAAVFIWAAGAWSSVQTYRKAMSEVRLQMSSGRFATAASNLAKVLDLYPRSDEAAYLLGVCEQQRGDVRKAAAAWARVEPGSPSSEQALTSRALSLFKRGQLGAIEELVDELCRDARNERTGVRALLIPSFRQTGRVDDAKRLVEDRWQHLAETGQGAKDLAIRMVRMHVELTDKPPAIESLRAFNDQASRQAPNDDRVWLGHADLAIRAGNLDEANRWIDACLKSRPNDVPVWQSRLKWAMATNRVEEVRGALEHLPASASSQAQVHRIAAWLGSRQGDFAVERAELERLIDVDPADLPALTRLLELAKKDGQASRAAEFLKKKAEVIRLEARYAQLHERKQPVRHAVEMARLAEKLGRTFEARAFLTLAVGENPDRADLQQDLERLIRSASPAAPPTATLAQAVANELASHATTGDHSSTAEIQTHAGADGIGPDTMTHGFDFRPNPKWTPFGSAGYRYTKVAGDWYVFSASNDF